MKLNEIRKLATAYRFAIETARNENRFTSDFSFRRFPHGCCGDTSYLLAEYLKRKGVETVWYSAQRDDWSHAWLVVKDERVTNPSKDTFYYPDEIKEVLSDYGLAHPERVVDVTRYEEANLSDGTIIDITADQFSDYDVMVYVGSADRFHHSFNFVDAHDYDGLKDGRLNNLYRIIEDYL